ncbi:MAG: sulfotransferase family protein [Anaerolineae bacterium]|nr:sulfotransferase family protein [Anaerolineae bacterium]
MTTNDCQRICLWSGPRNVSTALMYAFAQRSDTRVVDEPLYGHYLKASGAPHPGAAEVIAAMDTDGERVIRDVIFGPCDRPILFTKNMPHHLINLDWTFLQQTTNVILTRSPEEMLPSYAQQVPNPNLSDTSYDLQVELLEKAVAWGQDVPVIESRELLSNPGSVLRELCRRLGIAFASAMLEWPAGPRPEDGVWAKYWYDNVHRSTGFAPYKPKVTPFPDYLRPLLNECRPYYDKLSAYAIRVD